MLQLEEEESWVSTLLYRAVIHAVLLLGLESWGMSNTIMKEVEGKNVGLLQQITGKRAKCQTYGAWEKLVAEEVLWEVETQSEYQYIGRQQVTVVQWVALDLLLEVFLQDTILEGGGKKR